VQTSDSATFTSDATGHGMTVTVDKNKVAKLIRPE
jgi:hypothetical protein